jgi:protein-disulfide isomerase
LRGGWTFVATCFAFALGFLLAGLIGFDLVPREPVEVGIVAQAVQASLTALSPTEPPPPTNVPTNLTYSARDYSIGPEDAPITLVEFSDYRCQFCGRFALETLNDLLEEYDGLLRFVYRDYPIFGEDSVRAAHAAYCADLQESFWDYHFLIFESQTGGQSTQLDPETLVAMAEDLALDADAFTRCLNNQNILDEIIQNILDAQDLLGNAPTPTFLLNGNRMSGALPIDSFRALLNQELRRNGIDPPE